MKKSAVSAIALALVALGSALWLLQTRSHVPASPHGTKSDPKPSGDALPATAHHGRSEDSPAATIPPGTRTHTREADARLFGEDGPVSLADIPAGRFRDQLLALSPQAQAQALEQLASLRVPVNNIGSLQVDRTGRLFYECPAAPPLTVEEVAAAADWEAAAGITAEFSGPVPIAQPPVFHSKAGASRTIYLDFNGHTLTGTAWNSTATTYAAQPFDTDGNPALFSVSEQNTIKMVWARVAEDFRAFDVNVTTESPTTFGATTGTVLITHSTDQNGVAMPSATSGGVAYLAVFGAPDYSYYSPALVYFNNLGLQASSIAEVASHEMGHNLGLSHDGTTSPGGEYYGGHGWGDTSWAPIMGASSYRAVTQWSKGEYYRANNPQDDLAIIANHLGLVADDHSDIELTPTSLMQGSNALSGAGIIGAGGDVDRFAFSLSTPQVVELRVTPLQVSSWDGGGNNLHPKLDIYRGDGTLVGQSVVTESPVTTVVLGLPTGSYYVRVTGTGYGMPLASSPVGYTAYGSMGHYALTGRIAPAAAPSFTSWSGPATTVAGSYVGISVQASGAPTPTYQWQRRAAEATDWIDLTSNDTYAGTTSYSLSVYNATLAMSGDHFRCVASNTFGTVTSAAIPLTVNPGSAPTVYNLPPSLHVPHGEILRLEPWVAGTSPITFQWSKNGIALADQNSGYLYRYSTTDDDAGDYTLTATNSWGTTTSAPVAVTIAAPVAPTIIMPASRTVAMGAYFDISPSITGTSPMTYEWRRDGVLLDHASSYYYISSSAAEHTGVYTIKVTNAAGTTTSMPVTITVSQPVAPQVWGLPPTVTIPAGGSIQLSPTSSGTQPMTFQWSKDGAVVAGSTNSNYYRWNAQVSDSGTYWLTVSNSVGTATSSSVTVTVLAPVAPSIYGLPPSVTRDYGNRLDLSATVSGTSPIALQWTKDGVAIPGATNSYFSKSSATPADSGSYALTATNAAGTVTGPPVSVTIRPAIAPAIWGLASYYERESGTSLNLSPQVSGTEPIAYQWRKNGSNISGATNPGFSKDYVLPADSGEYTLVATNIAGSTTSASVTVAVAEPVAPTIFGLPPTVDISSGNSFYLYPTVRGTRPITFQWKKGDSLISGATNESYGKNQATTTDSGPYTLVATNAFGSTTSTVIAVTVAVPIAPSIHGLPTSVTVPASESLYLSPTVHGTSPLSYQWRKDGEDIDGGTSQTFHISTVTAADAGIYSLTATNAAGSATSSSVTVLIADPIAPAISTLPSHVTIQYGGNLSFHPSVTGTRPISYQWRRDGTPITGQTERYFYKSYLTSSDSGDYTLVATNVAGSSTSTTVAVVVEAPIAPIFVSIPTSIDLASGQQLSLNPGVSGTSPITYQWRKDGALLSQATYQSFSKWDSTVEDSGSYTVTATNAAGSTTSPAIVVTVRQSSAPVITEHPVSRTVTSGRNVAFTVVATGVPDPVYEWRKNGSSLSNGLSVAGATSATLLLTNCQLDDAGEYDVRVSNSRGNIVSNRATLAVTSSPTNQPPTAAFTLSGERVIGQTITISLNVNDPDGDFAYATLWIRSPRRGWMTIKADASAISGAVANADAAVTTTAGMQTRTFRFTHLDGPGNYTFGVAAVDAQGLVGQAAQRTITVSATQPAAGSDYDRDGHADLLWQNTQSGQRNVWLMRGFDLTESVDFAVAPTEWAIVARADFNVDGHADVLWQHMASGTRSLWYLNDTTLVVDAPVANSSPSWHVVAVADFNGDRFPDLVEENLETTERRITLMVGAAVLQTISLGALPLDWAIVGAADFNGDNHADILWQESNTGDRVVWLMNGTSLVLDVGLPSAGSDWLIEDIADLNGDGWADLIERHRTTDERGVRPMVGLTPSAWHSWGVIPTEWRLRWPRLRPSASRSAAQDFDGDGQNDLLWQNGSNGQRNLWFMHGATLIESRNLTVVPPEWFVVGCADMNLDGQTDLVWQHRTTGARNIWFMNGTSFVTEAPLPNESEAWQATAFGDFNGDGFPDLVEQNTATAERRIQLLAGAHVLSTVSLGSPPLEWTIVGVADLNGDGHADIVWQHSAGDRAVWLMNGTSVVNDAPVPGADPLWRIRGVIDLDGDGAPDLLESHQHTNEHGVRFLNGLTNKAWLSWGVIPAEWSLSGSDG